MSEKARHYIQTRSTGQAGTRSPVNVEIHATSDDRRAKLAERGFLPVMEKAAMIATYAKVPIMTAPALDKVRPDGTSDDKGSVFVPAWLHAFFILNGRKDSHIERIRELKEDVRSQLILVGQRLLVGGLTPRERKAYEAFIEKTSGATTA